MTTTNTGTNYGTTDGGSSQSTATQAKDATKDAAAEVTSTAKEQASAVADTSKQQVQQVAQDAKAQAQQLVSQSREQLRTQADEQAKRVASTLGDIGRQLDAMARGDGAPQGMVADATRQLASAATGMGDRLENGGFEGLIDEARTMARNKPGMFLLAAFGAGFALTRVMRAADTHSLMEAAKPSDGSAPSDTATQQADAIASTLTAGSIPPAGPEVDIRAREYQHGSI